MDVERGMKAIPPRRRRDHLLIARYSNQSRVADHAAKWCGYADPLKQAMADAGLIPQSPVIGETVDTRGIVNTKVALPRDAKLYRGKDNGKPRGEVVVQCTKPQHPTPVVVGSFWPRGKDKDGNLVIRPMYAPRARFELDSVVDTVDPTLVGKVDQPLDEFFHDLHEIVVRGILARKGGKK